MLQQVPGLHTDEMSGKSGISSLYLRGADPNFTLIMLDSIPMNDSTNHRGGSVDLSTIPIDRIDRVEIVHGPLSAFYGSEAMAGAINFITKSASTAPSLRLLGEGSRFDYLKGPFQTGGSVGPLSTNISISHTKNGEQIEKDQILMDSAGWIFFSQTDSNFDMQLNGQYTDSMVRSFPEGSDGFTTCLAPGNRTTKDTRILDRCIRLFSHSFRLAPSGIFERDSETSRRFKPRNSCNSNPPCPATG